MSPHNPYLVQLESGVCDGMDLVTERTSNKQDMLYLELQQGNVPWKDKKPLLKKYMGKVQGLDQSTGQQVWFDKPYYFGYGRYKFWFQEEPFTPNKSYEGNTPVNTPGKDLFLITKFGVGEKLVLPEDELCFRVNMTVGKEYKDKDIPEENGKKQYQIILPYNQLVLLHTWWKQSNPDWLEKILGHPGAEFDPLPKEKL